MNSFVSSAVAAETVARLPLLREQYSSAAFPEAKFGLCNALARAYLSLGLSLRARAWLHVAERVPENELSPGVVFEHHLLSVTAALEEDDLDSARRSVERLRAVVPGSVEHERELLEALIRVSLLDETPEPFAALEKAFRHLRHHPSPLWSSRFLHWRARWQNQSGREDEALVTLKKALTDAQRAGDRGTELLSWLALATAPASSKAKAVRAARTALEKASEWDMPGAVAEAHRVLSGVTAGPRESESAKAFVAYYEAERRFGRQWALWDHASREADSLVFDGEGQERRRLEAEMLSQIATRLAGDADLSRCLDGIYVPLKALMAADVFGIALWEPEQGALDYALFIEEGRRTRVGLIPVESTRSLGAWCFREKKALRINDIDQEYKLYLKELSKLSEHRPKSMLFQPLLTEQGARGIVTVQSFSKGSYGPEAAAFLAVVASCVALRLQSAPRSD